MLGRNPNKLGDEFPLNVLDEVKARQEELADTSRQQELRLSAVRILVDPELPLTVRKMIETVRMSESSFYRYFSHTKELGSFAVRALDEDFYAPRHQALRDAALYLAVEKAREATDTEEAIKTWGELYGKIANPAAANEAIATVTGFSGKRDVEPIYNAQTRVVNESIQIISLGDGLVIDEGLGQRVFALGSTVDGSQFDRAALPDFTTRLLLQELSK